MQPYQLDSTDWIKQELAGLLGEQVTRDINDIIRLYSLYDGDGQRWRVETKGLDYTPTVKVTNIIAELIGKEARYMMGVEPELHIVPKEKDSQTAQADADIIGDWLTALLEEQKWSKKLLDAAKDCFIGKRVALKLTGRRGGKLGIQFRPSLEFVFDTDPEDVDNLPVLDFTVSIDHRYPIADDEDAERTLDLQEVSQQARSRKSYLEKWQPDADGNAELAQIAAEQKMLDDGFDAAVSAETEAAAQNAL